MARTKPTKRTHRQLETPTDCVALYIRVSTDKQADEGYSLEAQQAKLEAYCLAQGWLVCEEHIYIDAGESAKSTARPAFHKMIGIAEAGAIQRIVAVKLDRMARNVRDFLNTVDRLQKAGCELALIQESFDTSTPHGKFALTVFAAMAELELSTIQERTMAGRRQKAAQGGYNGSKVPIGYSYDGDTFIVNSEQAGTIVRIFEERLEGKTLQAIADGLNADSIPTHSGGLWYPGTVKYILGNGIYAGLIQYNGHEVEGTHEPIITLEAYNDLNPHG